MKYLSIDIETTGVDPLNNQILSVGIIVEDIPNLTVCKERAGTGDVVTHNAIEDAWDVVQLLRTQY